MGRLGFLSAILALLLVVVIAGKSESNSTSPSNVPAPLGQSTTLATPDNGSNKTKDGLGQGYGGHRRNNDYDHKKHRGGYRRRHDDEYDAFPYSKPYFDTHYCSVHGSFRLSYNEKYEKKEYEGGNKGYQQQQGGYGNNAGSYGNNGGSYGNNGGSYGNNGGSYGKNEGSYGKNEGSYGNKGGYEHKEKHRYVRKITRQYCRYAAAWSEKACKFCCKVVARSAYTNPDDIIAAIFSFDPANPSSGGYGVESYGNHHDNSNEYGHDKSYENHREGGYGNQGGYENQGGYGNQGGYENQGNYNQGGGNNYGGGQSYGQQQNYSPPQYGNGPYRSKRNAGYSQAPAPAYGSPPPAQSYDQYQQPPADQYQAPADQYTAPSDQYSATPDAYSTKPDQGNKYENSANAMNQCVCCAPKHRYY